jgi:hypothetical protein
MAANKRRRSFRRPPERVERLLQFALFSAAYFFTEKARTPRMLELLGGLVDALHREGYAAPTWLHEPFQFYQRRGGARDRRPGPKPDEMVYLLEGIYMDLPEDEQPAAVRTLLGALRSLYKEASERPEWLRLALERYEME